jgi:DNA-binding Lrp family transcriptional regulator
MAGGHGYIRTERLELSVREKILTVLARGAALSHAQIAERLNRKSVADQLAALERAGLIRARGAGVWRVWERAE